MPKSPPRLGLLPLGALAAVGCVARLPEASVTLDDTMVTRAFVHVDVDPGTTAHVVYGDADADDTRVTPDADGPALDFVLYAHAGGTTRFRVEGVDADGRAVHGPDQTFDTDALPDGVPGFTEAVPVTVDGLGPWLLTSALSDNAHATVLIVTTDGRPVWYWQPGDAVVAAARYDASSGTVYGSAFDPANDAYGYLFDVPVRGGAPTLRALTGAHHDTVRFDDGGGPIDAQLVTVFQDVDGQTIAGDTVVEIDAAGGQRTVWSAFDALTPTENAGWTLTQFPDHVPDWTHANGLWYDAASDDYLVSLWWPEQVVRIDRATGATAWVMGGDSDTFTFTDGDAFGPQHAPAWADGQLTVFDNRSASEGSRAVEYAVDEAAHTATVAWQFSPPEPSYALVLGDVTRRADGSHLLGWGSTGDVYVTDADDAVAGFLRLDQPLAIGAVTELAALP